MNNLAELLSSPPDEISELNGVELVRQKVEADENDLPTCIDKRRLEKDVYRWRWWQSWEELTQEGKSSTLTVVR